MLIVGGGPAGLAAALTLLNQTDLYVCVVESSDYSGARIGESVSPGIIPLLRYLKIEDEFLAAGHIPSSGIDAAWGTSNIRSRDFFFTGHGEGWNLDRRAFDTMMAQAVRKRGGALFTSAKIMHYKKEEKWSAKILLGNEEQITVQSDFVIDASGKGASFARTLGAKWQVIDKMVGVAGMYKTKKESDVQAFTLLESTPEGWWYSNMLPDNMRVVVFMTDGDIAKKLGMQKKENWDLFLKETLHVQKTLKGAKLAAPPRILPAHSQVIKKADLSDWLPAGDAAASFDPLSSMGIGHAIVSGISAARAAYNHLKSDGTMIGQYIDNVNENFERYLQNRKRFYSYEKRWREKPFWKRRNA